MTFAENINRICAEKGTNLTAIVKAVKGSSYFATAINTKWSLPKESEMLEMAKLLECSVMDFFADKEDLPETKPANEDEEDILRIYRGLSRRAKHEFMSMAYEFENREELEEERRDLEGQIAREEMKKPLLTKERIMFWLVSFKSGDIRDIEYQQRVIDTLVNSVYLYDEGDKGRKLVLTFNISGSNTLTIQCSDIEGSTPPNSANPNTLFFVKHCFGFVYHIKDVG